MIVSVIICCYNSVNRLESTLRHLAKQEDELGVEIILVDNLSTDGTADYAKLFWKELDAKISMRIVVEKQPGLSYARLAGAKASSGEFLIFCDDDNSLSPDYCLNVTKLFYSNPEVGIIGGYGLPVFEKKPKTWITNSSVITKFAVGPQAALDGPVDEGRLWVYGAGMAIRKEIFFRLHEMPTFLSDRKGKELTGGGDVELCLKAVWLGYKVYYSSILKFEHHIPVSRSSFAYLWKMVYPNVLGGLIVKAYKISINNAVHYYVKSPSKRLFKDLISKFIKVFVMNDLFSSCPYQQKILSLYGYLLTGYLLLWNWKIIDQTFQNVWSSLDKVKQLQAKSHFLDII